MTEPKPSYDAGGEQPDAKTVLENTRVLREQLRAGEVRFVDGKRYRDTLCIVWDALAVSEARVEALEKDNRGLRELAWISDPAIERYGDDGEMQAGHIDYLRFPVAEIMRLRMNRGLAALAAAPNAPSDAPDAASPRQGLGGGSR